jgi:hypothetical protein
LRGVRDAQGGRGIGRRGQSPSPGNNRLLFNELVEIQQALELSVNAIKKPSTQVKQSNEMLPCGAAMVLLIDEQAMKAQTVHQRLADWADINLHSAPIRSRAEWPMKSTRRRFSRVDREMPSTDGLKRQSASNSGEAVDVLIECNGLRQRLGSEEIAPQRPLPNCRGRTGSPAVEWQTSTVLDDYGSSAIWVNEGETHVRY